MLEEDEVLGGKSLGDGRSLCEAKMVIEVDSERERDTGRVWSSLQRVLSAGSGTTWNGGCNTSFIIRNGDSVYYYLLSSRVFTSPYGAAGGLDPLKGRPGASPG